MAENDVVANPAKPVLYFRTRKEFVLFPTDMAQLPNYLRSNRKRLSLSQEDVAFLLNKPATNLPRYEQFYRTPDLETALACEVIFQRSASEIFGGLYQKAEQGVIERAKVLAEKTDMPAKRTVLMNIANKILN